MTAVREACATTGGQLWLREKLIMLLIICYLGLVAAGDVLAYFLGFSSNMHGARTRA
jgi:hypothetical protein